MLRVSRFISLNVQSGSRFKSFSAECGTTYLKGVKNHQAVAHNYNGLGSSGFDSIFEFWRSYMHNKLDFKIVDGKYEVDPSINSREKLVGGDDQRRIIMETKERFDGDICAIFDSHNPSRAFIGHTMTTGSSCPGLNQKLRGGFIYFDSKGKQTGGFGAIWSPIVSDLDSRYGMPRTVTGFQLIKPDEKNMFLHKDTLVFAWQHRDIPGLRLSGALFGEDDKMIESFELHTDVGHKLNESQKPVVQLCNNRWLSAAIKGDDRDYAKVTEHACFDLKSFRFVESPKPNNNETRKQREKREKEFHLSYDMVTLPTATLEDTVHALNVLTDVPSHDPTHRNGYPIQCIKCGGKLCLDYLDLSLVVVFVQRVLFVSQNAVVISGFVCN